jgi:hypothetical protein
VLRLVRSGVWCRPEACARGCSTDAERCDINGSERSNAPRARHFVERRAIDKRRATSGAAVRCALCDAAYDAG